MKEVSKELTDDLKYVMSIVDEENAQVVVTLKNELIDNWKKRQLYRTEVEMRISVLNDVQHPTDASKYWQAVLEMSVMFDALMRLSFDIRRNEIKRHKLHQKMEKFKDDELEQKSIQIDIDENLYEYANMKRVAEDRIRELKLWSKIKEELDNGEFDTQNPNTHQYESYKHYWTNRVNALNETSSPGDVMNAVGPLQSLKRLNDEETGKIKSFDKARKNLQESNNHNP
jgi:hypothetical protein